MGKRKSSTIIPDAKLRQTKLCKVSDEKQEHLNGKTTSKSMLYGWCTQYPGSIPTLTNPSITKWNMKLSSWNVNGLRAWLKSDGLSYLHEESADVFCIQEIKCSNSKVPPESKVSGYHTFWSSAEKEGYAGTALYSKCKPISVTYGIGISKHDKEGRVITAEYENFYLINVYVPNSGEGLVRLSYRQREWDQDFISYLKKLDSIKPLIVCGDLNVSHEPIDLANPKSNCRSAGFTDEEREDFTKMLAEVDLVDTYRSLYPSRENAYTYWSYRARARPKNVGWRLDYFLVSKRLMVHVCDQEIRCGVPGSDHTAIVLYMHFDEKPTSS